MTLKNRLSDIFALIFKFTNTLLYFFNFGGHSDGFDFELF